MSGIFMLGLAIVWFAIAVMLSRRIGRSLRRSSMQTATALAAFAVLLPLPVADELVGMWQFNRLCREGAKLKIDPDAAKGRTVRLVIDPSNEILPGQVLTTYHSHLSYREVGTDQEIASFSRYSVKGGWLIRALGIFESNVPLVIGKSWCSVDDRVSLPARYEFTLIN